MKDILLSNFVSVDELIDKLRSLLSAQGNQQTHDVASNANAVETQDKKDTTDATDSQLEDSVEFGAFALLLLIYLLMRASDDSFWIA